MEKKIRRGRRKGEEEEKEEKKRKKKKEEEEEEASFGVAVHTLNPFPLILIHSCNKNFPAPNVSCACVKP